MQELGSGVLNSVANDLHRDGVAKDHTEDEAVFDARHEDILAFFTLGQLREARLGMKGRRRAHMGNQATVLIEEEADGGIAVLEEIVQHVVGRDVRSLDPCVKISVVGRRTGASEGPRSSIRAQRKSLISRQNLPFNTRGGQFDGWFFLFDLKGSLTMHKRRAEPALGAEAGDMIAGLRPWPSDRGRAASWHSFRGSGRR